MQFLLSFILFCVLHVSAFSAAVDDSIDLESRIRGWFTEYKKAAPASTLQLKRSATFVGHLHHKLLEQETEDGVDLYSRAILAVISRGAGVGGLRVPKNYDDKSHLLTPEEKAIVKSALIDAERLRRSWSGWDVDYFGSEGSYYARAGSNGDAQSALARHSYLIKRKANHIWDLKDCINEPEKAVDEKIRPGLTEALINLDLSETAMRHPKIYDVRVSSKTYSNFDIFNIAFYGPGALDAILFRWDAAYRYIPITYFALHGLPNHASALRDQFTAEVRRIAQTTPLFDLLRDSLETAYSYKYEHRLPSAIVLQVFLDQGLPGLEEASPETSPRLTPANQRDMLNLFKNAGKHVYTDSEQHTPILLDALTRFMKYYPTCPLDNIIKALVNGVSYMASDKNDFYFKAMKILYEKAISLNYPHNKEALWQSVKYIFQSTSQDTRDLALKKELAADLLTKDCLDVRQIGSFYWGKSDSHLSGKFNALIKVMDTNDLIVLLSEKEIVPSFKDLIKNELFLRGQSGLLSEEDAANVIDGLTTFSTWPISDLDKLDSDLKATIRTITTPGILLNLMRGDRCTNYKKLLIQRLVELKAWDTLAESLNIQDKGGDIFSHTVQLLQDHGQLNAARMIYAAQYFRSDKAKNKLLEKVGEVTFTAAELQRFNEILQRYY